MLFVCVLLARRNLRLRRGDRAGANRFALAFFVALLSSWLLSVTHLPHLFEEFGRLLEFTARSLLPAATLWLLYIALEPYVRRHWPAVLISWTRLLTGRFRDPLIGRDILLGGVLGVASKLWPELITWGGEWFGVPRDVSWLGAGNALFGGRHSLGELLSPGFICFALFFLFTLMVLRLLLRRQWLAVLVLFLIMMIPSLLYKTSTEATMAVVARGPIVLLVFMVLIRFGLLAGVASFFFQHLLEDFPVTTDLSAWYAGPMLLSVGVALVVAGYAFHTSLAGRPLFKDPLLES